MQGRIPRFIALSIPLAGIAALVIYSLTTQTSDVTESDANQSDGLILHQDADQDMASSTNPKSISIESEKFAFDNIASVNQVPVFPEFKLVGYVQEPCQDCGGGFQSANGAPPARMMLGVNADVCQTCREPRWRDGKPIPFESFSYGEYIGPHRTPHVPEYRIRVRDQLEFVYIVTRQMIASEYRFGVGDTMTVTAPLELEDLRQPTVTILPDGSVSLPQIGRVIAAGKTLTDFQAEVNQKYIAFGVRDPQIVIQGLAINTRLQDLRDSVDARAGVGGQSRQAEVSPDGTIQLPVIHSVPAVGLTLRELAREVNARYANYVEGIEVTPILVQRAPRVAYVLGEVDQPGRIELVGPTSAMQSIALAGGWNTGGNIRQIVIFRRDENWNLMATRLDLGGALHGKRPYPSDEIWIRDGDIVLVPKSPIQRLADVIDLYATQTIYALFPYQGFFFDFNNQSNF